MPPDAFERLCQRLLRQAGFINVVVIGRTGDGGIDGVGTYRMSLIVSVTPVVAARYCCSAWELCCSSCLPA